MITPKAVSTRRGREGTCPSSSSWHGGPQLRHQGAEVTPRLLVVTGRRMRRRAREHDAARRRGEPGALLTASGIAPARTTGRAPRWRSIVSAAWPIVRTAPARPEERRERGEVSALVLPPRMMQTRGRGTRRAPSPRRRRSSLSSRRRSDPPTSPTFCRRCGKARKARTARGTRRPGARLRHATAAARTFSTLCRPGSKPDVWR
jgi:hypothetical protein